jgi:hypothetical protein
MLGASDLVCPDNDRREADKMKSTDPADYQYTPRPIAGMAKDFTDGFCTEAHTHPRAQLT